MAHYHLHVRPGPKGVGAEHVQYIERGGRFKTERYGEIGESARGNLPDWAKGSAARFFAAADERERANGNAYREFEIALPKELSDAERGRLVRAFVAEQLGDKHAYAWAIHEPRGHNPHAHVMFSERLRDGIERGPEQYFKRANAKNPERGGHLKSDRFTSREGPQAVESLRVRWAEMQNQALERAGVEARVDHRSLKDQGIEREAGQHRGPAVSGVEARGEVAEVSVRREAERVERARERAAVEAEVRVVTRQEMALERVAVRERRELAREVTGEARAVVLPLVEADRREQLGRAQAAAERRVERRQGLSMGGQLKEKLLTQARALRERIGEQLGRVKAWVAERFPEPLERLKGISKEVFNAVAQKTRAREPKSGKAPAKGRQADSPEPEREPAPPPDAGRSDAAERAQMLKEATALGRQELGRQVQAVREERAARQRLDDLVRQERERQRTQQLDLERQRELERVQKLEQERALKRGKDRGLGR
jgi:MobA/MobL family